MTYPKIYSLSTVGLIKHYNNDYLLHHQRTDFIGPNGVGKSILADLLQLMFIYDKELIRFGTEDVKETRYIHTLPYLTGCAYCFLNIVVQKDQFITVGIQLQDQERRRIIPFVITKRTELHANISDLVLRPDELLFSADFIKDGVIPDIKDLAERLNNDRNVKLLFFPNKDAVQEYYQFLSAKEILPINLSNANNLKAFAKVIQSFSKAKTLKLSGKEASKSLKAFLFEEKSEEISFEFDKEKHHLEKVLNDYHRLNEDIKTLRAKQKWLVQLKEQDETQASLSKAYDQAVLLNCQLALRETSMQEEEGRMQIKQHQLAIATLQRLIDKIPTIEAIITKQTEIAEQKYQQASRYQELSLDSENIKDEIIALKMLKLPVIYESWKKVTAVRGTVKKSADEIISALEFATPYLQKYRTLDEIERVRSEQMTQLDQFTSQFQEEKMNITRLLATLQNTGRDSLLSWYIQQLPDLEESLLPAVLHFAALPTRLPKDAQPGDRIIYPQELDQVSVQKVDNGLWIKSGATAEFISLPSEADWLTHRSELENGLQKFISSQQTKLANTTAKLQAIAHIRNGLDFDQSLLDYPFDKDLSEYSQINLLKQHIATLLSKDQQLQLLESTATQLLQQLRALQLLFGVKYAEPEVIEKELKRIRQQWDKRGKKISRYAGEKEEALKSLRKTLYTFEVDLRKIAASVVAEQQRYDGLRHSYYQRYQENFSPSSSDQTDLFRLEKMVKDASDAYQANYIEASTAFEETKGRKNSEVNFERDQQSYSFAVLERALLGRKVKTTDDIATVLQDANSHRTQIADNIRDNMIKIFSRTSEEYDEYKKQVQSINTFFVNRKISGKYHFRIAFEPSEVVKIEDLRKMASDIRYSATRGELQFDQPVTEFLEDFFQRIAKLNHKVPVAQLLDPKTYFHLFARLEDEEGEDVSGSTGESYSAIALLGVARLSLQKAKTKGLRFIILEELGSMDNTNFNIFPKIAEEFQYQIITMAPHTFNIGFSGEWYAHHLIKGKENNKINYYPASSYFKTSNASEELSAYLNKLKR